MPLPLHTARLTIRPFALGDLDALHAVYGDRDVMRWVDGSYETTADTERALRTHIAMHERDGFAFWAVIEAAAGELVGEVGLGRLDDGVEIGWTLAKRHWGRGLATEAAREALAEAHGALGIEAVSAVVRPENAPSRKVAEKLGMRLTGAREIRGREQLVYVSERNPALRAAR